MVPSQYALSWDSYKSNVCSGFSSLQQNSELVDLTLAADGYFVKVHKVLMALSSPYLKELISSAPCQHPVIFLNNVSYTTLCLILEYIYSGDVVVPSNNLKQFIQTAKSLHIKGLEKVNPQHVNLEEQEEIISTEIVNKSSDGKPQSSSKDEILVPSHVKKISIKSTHKKLEGSSRRSPRRRSDTEDYDTVQDTVMDETESYLSVHDSDVQEIDGKEDNNLILPDKSSSSLQFTVSIRGSLQVILNRYMYNIHSTKSSGTKRWRCLNYRNKEHRCLAYLVTRGNVVLYRANPHSHPFHDKKILAKIQKNAVYTSLEEANELKDKQTDDSARDKQADDSTRDNMDVELITDN